MQPALKFLWPEVLAPTGSPVTLGITLPHQRLRVSRNELKIAGGRAKGQSEMMSVECGAPSLMHGRGSRAVAAEPVLMH